LIPTTTQFFWFSFFSVLKLEAQQCAAALANIERESCDGQQQPINERWKE
jgi:hypothetical protein